jgi:hypothetical protein
MVDRRSRPSRDHYDEQTRTLTIETWAPGWRDVELSLLASDDRSVKTLLTTFEGGRRGRGFDVEKIRIQRPTSLDPP